SPGYASSVLSVPELGVIPSADFSSRLTTGRTNSLWRRGKPALTLRPETEVPENGNLNLITWQGKRSLLAESFRLTLTSIVLMSRNGDRPRTLVVTSPGAGEGKTTVSSNMA